MCRTSSACSSTIFEAAPVGRVAERRCTAHPHALGLGGGDLVADALGGDLALELRERQQHVEGQPPHAGGGVERLGDRHERGARLVERLDQLGEVEQRAGQPVDLVDDDDVDPAGGDIGQQPLQGRALERAARQAAIVIDVGQRGPAFAGLAQDVGGTRLALGIEAS